MNVFNIIGPIMVGPSSSHTAGAVRIGRVARRLLGEEPSEVTASFHGSFARTYRGHGTDRAVLAGIMDMAPDDMRIRDSMSIAEKKGILYKFLTTELKDAHPNTVLIEVKGISGKIIKVVGSSVGGGNISIKQINGIDVDFSGQYNTLIIKHDDVPGTIAAVTNILSGKKEINIAFMRVYRTRRGGKAIMIIETDQTIPDSIKESIQALPVVSGVTIIEPI